MAISISKTKINIKSLLAFVTILIVNFLLRIPATANGFFAFAYDQGRDVLQASSIIYGHNLTLIGPTTGLPGIFYGAYWYYLLAAVLAVSHGDPQIIGTLFGWFGVLTVCAIYFYLRSTLKSLLLTFCLTLAVSMSALWMFRPTVIWSTSIVPILMIGYLYILNRIQKNSSRLNFFLLGLVSWATLDFEFPWGIVMILFTLSLPIFSKRFFLKKQYLFTLLGFLVMISPRILFNIRNQFLELNTFLAYIKLPKIYGIETNLLQRFFYRLDLFLDNFSQAFTNSNKILGILVIELFLLAIFLLIKFDKSNWKKLKNDFILRCSALLTLFSFILFTFYKDTVWDYYLIGLPITVLIMISRILNYTTLSEKYAKAVAWLAIIVLLILNFNQQIFRPFSFTWLGDGGTYRTQKAVMDYIAAEKPHNYTIYAYSPSIFDYPFDYLISWYTSSGKIEKPQTYSRLFYMIVREANSDRYLKIGWYGDKTRDRTKVLERKYFPGNIMLEKHERY